MRWSIAVICLSISACGADVGGPARAGEGGSPSITVLAAASLTEAFTAASTRVPQVRPTFAFAGSQQLVTQLAQGARADVVATADEPSMQRLVDAGLVGSPTTFARTSLVIAVAAGNPKGITELADLGRPGVEVVLADPSVPAGRYARLVLDAAGVRVSPRSLELDVKATLAKVTSGTADAALVYATDVRRPGGKVAGVSFPEATAPAAIVSYRIAVVRATTQRRAAEAFAAAAVDGPVHDALLEAGFTT